MSDQVATPGGRRGMPARLPAPGAPSAAELVVVKQEPFNAEAPMSALAAPLTPTPLFYVRSNYAVPALSAAGWRLAVEGAVRQARVWTCADLQALPAHSVSATLECAGNDRTGFTPLPTGEPWGSGALSTGTWRGAALRDVLDAAGLPPTAVEVLFEGADRDTSGGATDGRVFARSLPRADALAPDVLLAYEMNGAPLPAAHGGPVRLLVPDWYGVASVKWLVRIVALETPFTGYYQAERYIMDVPGAATQPPLRTMQVKSLITAPAAGAVIAAGRQRVAGVAWSGDGPITALAVQVDDGPWEPAQLEGPVAPHTWQPWTYTWAATPGRHIVRARATDSAGHTQPEIAPWNRLGYVNNAIQALPVDVGVPAARNMV
ncbi:MAG TPA: sulfite oxidase [Chloroflexia bacterium]|nr:sulfite oxidase [Chloroflexia bacterium]